MVISMYRWTTSMPTGTYELVKLEVANKGIIKSWCNGIVFFYK